MTEQPYLNETSSRWIRQEWHMDTWMQRAVHDDEDAARRVLEGFRKAYPERVYRLVEEVLVKTRFVRVPANEAGKPLPRSKKDDILDSSATTEGTTDDSDTAGDERGQSSLGEGEARPEDGQVHGDRVQV